MSEVSQPFSWAVLHWHTEVVLGLLLIEYIYLFGVGRLRHRYNWADNISKWQIASFSLGIAIAFIALVSPIAEIAEFYLFSGHMIQHLLLFMVLPPLILLGIPSWLLRPVFKYKPIFKIGLLLTNPIVAFASFNIVLLLWHFPEAYESTLNSEAAHASEHILFIATGLLTWWPILSPLSELPRLPYPGQIAYLFFQSIPMGFLGAAITFAPNVIYTYYATAPRIWEISPIADQQIGGMLMKTAGSLIFLLVLTIIFFRWAKNEGSDWMRPGPT